MIRPEALAWLQRRAELLAALALALLGLWWALRNYGVLQILGWALVPVGLIWAVIAWQRVRFAARGRGPGVVFVDEGEVSYYGPLEGGALQARELDRLILDPSARPAHWVLEQSGEAPLHIPVNADGAEALFDVFATLPGLRTEYMLAQMQGGSVHPVVIWERKSAQIPRNRLH